MFGGPLKDLSDYEYSIFKWCSCVHLHWVSQIFFGGTTVKIDCIMIVKSRSFLGNPFRRVNYTTATWLFHWKVQKMESPGGWHILFLQFLLITVLLSLLEDDSEKWQRGDSGNWPCERISPPYNWRPQSLPHIIGDHNGSLTGWITGGSSPLWFLSL